MKRLDNRDRPNSSSVSEFWLSPTATPYVCLNVEFFTLIQTLLASKINSCYKKKPLCYIHQNKSRLKTLENIMLFNRMTNNRIAVEFKAKTNVLLLNFYTTKKQPRFKEN